MDVLTQLRKVAELRGAHLLEKAPGHWHIKGELLVNYYPLSRTRTAYVAGTTTGKKHVTPEDAVKMAFHAPSICGDPAKRRKNRSKIAKQRLFNKLKGCCFVCGGQMHLVRHIPDDPELATFEHMVPLGRGGLDNMNNITLSHLKCNNDRGHDMPELKKLKAPYSAYVSRSQIDRLEFSNCATCKETIIWTTVKATQKKVPLDPKPVGGSEIDPAYARHSCADQT